MRFLRTALLACLASAALAQDETIERVVCRVTSLGPGSAVTVDRGSTDGVVNGDRVSFYPRGGGTYMGNVIQVDARTAVVELDDKNKVPAPGTRGEVLVPKSRLAPKEEPKKEEPAKKGEPEEKKGDDEHPPWKNKDEEYTPDKPLLAGVRPVRPEQRPRQTKGRVYVVGTVTNNPGRDYRDSIVRLGTDLDVSNLFGRGGRLSFNGEFAYLTERNEQEGLDLLIRELSYGWGGTRFAPTRWEFGRFLQHGMPEFGVLDGAEWTRRRDNGHVLGASLGFLPEPDEDFDTLSDFQFAAFYQFVSDPSARLRLTTAYQKTWHDGESDRDLLIAKLRYLPRTGWDVDATVWVDFYTGSDALKGSGPEVTHAIFAVRRRKPDGSGYDITYRHIRFPEILRNGEFLPPINNAADIENNRTDRLAIDGWRQLTETLQLLGHVSGWIDEDDSGGAAEIGFVIENLFAAGSRVSVVAVGTVGQFEHAFGGRFTVGRYGQRGHWDVLYEGMLHHQFDFPDDRDDIVQHRVRISVSRYFGSGFDVSIYGEGLYWDEDLSWTIGFHFQRRF